MANQVGQQNKEPTMELLIWREDGKVKEGDPNTRLEHSANYRVILHCERVLEPERASELRDRIYKEFEKNIGKGNYRITGIRVPTKSSMAVVDFKFLGSSNPLVISLIVILGLLVTAFGIYALAFRSERIYKVAKAIGKVFPVKWIVIGLVAIAVPIIIAQVKRKPKLALPELEE